MRIATFYPQFPMAWFFWQAASSFFVCLSPKSHLDLLGMFLTPFLLISLLSIIAVGLWTGKLPIAEATLSRWDSFTHGLIAGWGTMDILGSFMFTGAILHSVQSGLTTSSQEQIRTVTICGSIGISLLAVVYGGMAWVAACHGQNLGEVGLDRLLTHLVVNILGNHAGLVICLAVSLACLTTAISLTLVFADFVSRECFQNKVAYRSVLAASCLISCVFATLEFEGIQAYLAPLLKLCLPSLVMLTLVNFCINKRDFAPVKIPVVATFIVSLIFSVLM